MIQITNVLLDRVFHKLGYAARQEGETAIAGVRGGAPTGGNWIRSGAGNTPNEFNDTLIVYGAAFGLFLGTVDPGATWTQHPENAEGCAHLTNGRYRYRFGLHKGKPALVQASPVTVRRDANRDGAAEVSEPLDTGWFGIDIHLMGNGPHIDDWSAGCQGVVREQWPRFYALLEATGQRIFSYTLVDVSDLDLPTSCPPRLDERQHMANGEST